MARIVECWAPVLPSNNLSGLIAAICTPDVHGRNRHFCESIRTCHSPLLLQCAEEGWIATQRNRTMNRIIWLVGAVVIILFVLGYFGLR